MQIIHWQDLMVMWQRIFADWLEKNFPERAKKVWNKVKSMHGGQVNDSRFGKRMSGEGNYAAVIKSIFNASKKKLFLIILS